MPKILGLIIGLTAFGILGALIGPSFIDWNRYKGELTHQIKKLTGRELSINGDIRVSLLPTPSLSAQDLALTNLEGATAEHMLTLKSAEVRVALAPLLNGKIKVKTINLVEPVVNLERMADGAENWDLHAEQSADIIALSEDSGDLFKPDLRVPLSIAMNTINVENATITYKDIGSGKSERVDKISASITAVSLLGPIEAKGAAVLRGLPIDFDIRVGEIIHGRTVPIHLRAKERQVRAPFRLAALL